MSTDWNAQIERTIDTVHEVMQSAETADHTEDLRATCLGFAADIAVGTARAQRSKPVAQSKAEWLAACSEEWERRLDFALQLEAEDRAEAIALAGGVVNAQGGAT